MLFNKNYIVIILSLLFLVGCNNNTNPFSNSDKGQIFFNVPIISSIVNETLNDNVKEKEKKSRAFISADLIVYEIYDDYGLFQTGSFTSDVMESSKIIEIIPGTYTMSVDIYNMDVSADTPVVSGISDSFIVNSQELSTVIVTTTPNETTIIDSEDTLILNRNDFVTSYIGNGVEMGSEKWFEYTALYDHTEISLDFPFEYYSSAFYLFIYDQNGSFIDVVRTFSDQSFTISGTAGDVYYIGVIYTVDTRDTTGSELNSITLSSSEVIVTDDDNTFEDSTPLTMDGSEFSGLLYDSDSDYYSITVTAGTLYQVAIDSDEDLDVIIYNSNFEQINSFSVFTDFLTLFHNEDDTLYIELTEDYYSGINNYNFSVSVGISTNITTSDQWQEISINDDEIQYYSLDVTPGASYLLSWDSSWEGSGLYSADVLVSVYEPLVLGDTYVYPSDSGYYEPRIFTIPDGVFSVIVEIYGYYEGGTLGVLLQEVVADF